MDKKKLIEFAEKHLKHIESRGLAGFPGDKLNEEIYRIALAALEAEPIGEVSLGEYDDCGNYPDASVVCLHEGAHWDNFPEGYTLYAAPPAPVVNIPSNAEFLEIYCMFANPTLGARNALKSIRAELLRLNSQG